MSSLLSIMIKSSLVKLSIKTKSKRLRLLKYLTITTSFKCRIDITSTSLQISIFLIRNRFKTWPIIKLLELCHILVKISKKNKFVFNQTLKFTFQMKMIKQSRNISHLQIKVKALMIRMVLVSMMKKLILTIQKTSKNLIRTMMMKK